MRVSMWREPSEVEAHGEDYDRLLAAAGVDHVCRTREWMASWLEVYGRSAELRVMAAWEGDELVGVAPMLRRRAPLVDLGGRRLEFISGRRGDCHDFIIRSGDEDFVRPRLLDAVLDEARGGGCAVFHNIHEESPTLPLLIEGLEERGLQTMRREERSPFLRLGDSADDMQSQWSRKHRGDLRRQLRRLEEIGPVELVAWDSEDEAQDRLGALMAAERTVARENRSLRKSATRRQEEFYRRLIVRLGVAPRGGGVHGSTLAVGGRPIAYHLGFVCKGRFHYYKPTYEIAYASYSPGKIHLWYLIKQCMNQGSTIFDFLRGAHAYKYRWTTDEIRVVTVGGMPPGLMSSTRAWWLATGKDELRRLAGAVRGVS